MVMPALLSLKQIGVRVHTGWASEQVDGPPGLGDWPHKGSQVFSCWRRQVQIRKKEKLDEPCGVGSLDWDWKSGSKHTVYGYTNRYLNVYLCICPL